MTYDEMTRIWKQCIKPVPEPLICEHCGGSAIEPEYGDDDPCMDCHGFGFDAHDGDLRAMRLLEMA